MENIEYKIIEGSAAECQKWLNQWKHEYEITVLSMSACESVASFAKALIVVTILLTRERR